MKCHKCRFENLESAKFCRKCGHKLEILCPECGNTIPPDSIFCQDCGHDLSKPKEVPHIDYKQPQSYTPKYLADKILTTRSSIEGERKLVTVLFADVANYTSISEKLDPEQVHEIIDGCFKILLDEIHRCEGTINQFTGDGVMALFGAPVAHEDHAQRACHAALSIRKAIGEYGQKIKNDYDADFEMRIGLNSGAVIVGSIGDDLRMDYTAVGDTSNLASRMQHIANPGSVLVSGPTHKLAMDFFEFEPLGKVQVKGKERPQEAYELIRASEVETRIEAAALKGLTRFVGRKKEMDALREAFESAKSGSGQVIGIVGEAGVGKSRLLLELRNTLPDGDHSFLEGRCLHYGGSMPYLAILDVLKVYFGIEEEDREATIKKKLRERLLDLDEKMEIVPPALHEVLSLKVGDEKYLQLGPQQRRECTFDAIRDLFIRESQRKPLILAVEDLHWIDKTSEDFLDYLIGFLPTAKILLILLYRSEYTHPWGNRSYYGKIGLDQLSARTSAELVHAILDGGEVAQEIARLVLGRAGGNPLFVEELTHSLVENGSIQRKDDQYVLAREASEIQVPDTIQGIIAARMDRVEENLKRIMQVASVIGRNFAYRILAMISGMKDELKLHLLNLQGLEFIYEKQLFPELEYIFKHAITQEVVYNSLLSKRRKEIHGKIGKAIEVLYAKKLEEHYEILAYHYISCDNKVKALEYLDLANQKAYKVSAMEEAKAHFEQSMNLFTSLPDTEEFRERRISLVVNQWYVYLLLLKVPDYYELLNRHKVMTDGIHNPGLVGTFYARLGACEWTFGSFSQSIQSLTEAVQLCEVANNTEIAGYAYVVLGMNSFFQGDFERALALKEEALRKVDEEFHLDIYERALAGAIWTCSYLGRWDEAVREGLEALKVAQDFSDNSHISFTAWSISLAYVLKGDLDRSIEYGELAFETAPTPGDKAWALGTLAWAWCRGGEVEKGLEVLAAVVERFRKGRYVIGELHWTPFLANGYLLDGQYDKARQTAEELRELADRCGAKHYTGWAHRLLGEIALRTNPDDAAPHFDKAISIFREMKAENELALAYSGMGRLHKQQGNTAQAREYLTKALEIFERLGTLIEPDKVRKELTDLPQ